MLSLGVAIIYSDYLYNPNGSLSTLQISNADESGYIDSTSSSKDKKFLQELDRWAAQNNATILFKDGLTAGAGYCGYSDWIDVHLEIQNTVSNDIGVYVQNSSIVFDPYVTDDVFLAGIAGL